MKPIGIMQGRMLPPDPGIYQQFPIHWAEEMRYVKKLGFSCIELLDDKRLRLRDLLSSSRDQVRRLIGSLNIRSPSICMDSLCSLSYVKDPNRFLDSIRELIALWCSPAIYVVPFFDKNAIEDGYISTLLKDLQILRPILESNGSKLALEFDSDYLTLSRHPFDDTIGLCYDFGNRGENEDLADAIEVLQKSILHVHVKRKDNGKNVRLKKTTGLTRALANLRSCNLTYILETCTTPDPLVEARQNCAIFTAALEAAQ